MKKKTLSLALALALCLGLTVPAFADEYGPLEIRFEQSSSEVVVLAIDQATLSGDTIMVKPESTFSVRVENMVGSWSNVAVGLYGDFQSKDGGWSIIPNLYEGVNEHSASAKNAAELFSRADRYIGYYDSEQVGALVRFVVMSGDCETKYYLFLDDPAQTKPDDPKPTDPEPTTPPAGGAETIPASGTAKASTQTVTVDGKAVEFQMYALADANGDLTNYIKLRDMAYILNGTKAQFSVGYDGIISLTTGKPYEAGGTEMTTPFSGDRAYTGGAQTVKIDGKDVAMTAITLTDDNGGGYNYFKLRDLGKALGFNVSWDNGVIVESDKPYAG